MIPFDVTSLFTFIPLNMAHEILRKRLDETYDEARYPLKIEHIAGLFEFFQETYFTFVGENYEQIKGTLRSPISRLLTELVLQELENTTFTQHELVIWCRYVEDMFVISMK
ncbi:unnamed protein product [Dibothriocephalus latus]|uniref:Reverse transcriptase domain-containing protein n=1 Tax=Dibothriocephalus latus TaxID=60516 RepID=A0A3P6SE58_DIBLA|nr:unnamed protein product [Dibothriocephalus latus]